MKRSFWIALVFSGAGWAASAQDAANLPPAEDPPALADPADSAADPNPPGAVDGTPDVGSEDATPPGFNPNDFVPGDDPSPLDIPTPGVDDPADDADAVRPGEGLEGAQPAEPGLPGSPPVDDAIGRDPLDPAPDTPDPATLPDTILDTAPVPDNDAPPADAATVPGTDVPNADGLGAPLIDEGTVPVRPEDAPPVDVDPRLPIERQPLPPDADFSEPLPADPDAFPAAPRRPVIDPAYAPPAPPRPQPQIEVGEVVRNPIRVYETRLLVLMGHWPAVKDATDVLARRFPTDARVPYLRFFHLSRTGDRDAALDALQKAVAMERLYPVTDYNRFMEPLQGPDRYYLERVRRAAAELAAADGLVEPDPDDVLPEDLRNAPPTEVDADEPPLPAAPSGAERRGAAGPPEIIDEPQAPSRLAPRELAPTPDDAPPADAAPAPGADAATDPDAPPGFDVEPEPIGDEPNA